MFVDFFQTLPLLRAKEARSPPINQLNRKKNYKKLHEYLETFVSIFFDVFLWRLFSIFFFPTFYVLFSFQAPTSLKPTKCSIKCRVARLEPHKIGQLVSQLVNHSIVPPICTGMPRSLTRFVLLFCLSTACSKIRIWL